MSEAGPSSSAAASADTIPDNLSYATMMLAEAELRLDGVSRQEQETDAMLLLARRENEELRAKKGELQEENDRLRKRLTLKRRGKAELVCGGHFSEAYDWVCEITKLTAVSKEGWKLQYSESFLNSMTAQERAMLMGTDAKAAPDDADDDEVPDDGPAGDGWSGAVVAVLGLFDKGKTFVLNHLTESQLPSGKKVSTKGLSFKHVDVEGTKFIILDSEGSYAPVKVENELSVVEKEMSEHFIQDVIFELADYFLCVVNDFTSLDQRYLDKLTRNLQNSMKVFKEVIVVHNCKTVMEPEVLQHIFETQVTYIYGSGKLQMTRVAAISPLTGQLEEKAVQWFKTDFSRHVVLAHKDCDLGDSINPWAFSLLRYWLKAVFVPVNRRFSVLQAVLQSCNLRMKHYFKSHPELTVVDSVDDPKLKLIRAVTQDSQMQLPQASVDASGLLLTRPNSFQPAIDIIRTERSYTIYMDVPGLTKHDVKLSRQNVTTIIKGGRSAPYAELQVRVEKAERKYGDFTQTFKIPQEYERKWSKCVVSNGVLKLVFKPDNDEEGLQVDEGGPDGE
tara:strand:- start:1141 stop:2823 length:1683 start_codon:yes stop_codon:yes gene_type:complete